MHSILTPAAASMFTKVKQEAILMFEHTIYLKPEYFHRGIYNNNNNNNTSIYKAPDALASEVLAAGQSWVLIKSLMEKARLKPKFKYRQR